MSVSQIVAQVTEQLTEGVSKFTLYVVRRKEEKSVIPPNLSQQVGVVSQQCNTVADLARELGQQFEEFPDILARITGEANGLESASRNLQATASNMGSISEDIAQSWERLANSCSSIADRVIRLMEVLFQAEHNRILAVANKAQQLLAENTAFTPNQLDQNSDFCASKASDAASEVAQLSQYLQDRALVEESPQGRQILLEQAQKMQQDSENIIATINRALEDPTNPASVAAYKEAVASSSRTIQQAVAKVQQIKEQRDQSRRQSAAPKPVSPSPARAAPGAGAVAAPRSPVAASSSSSSAAPRPVSKAPTAVVRSAADIDTKWKPQTMDQVAQAMDHVVSDSQGKDWMSGSGDLSIQIRRMAEAAKNGSRGNMLDAARTIATLSQQFAKTVKQQASTGAASASKDKLINNSLGLEDLCRQLKILASVKAGSSSLDLDRDEQLVSNTANIVRMWKELSDGLEISKIARK